MATWNREETHQAQSLPPRSPELSERNSHMQFLNVVKRIRVMIGFRQEFGGPEVPSGI